MVDESTKCFLLSANTTHEPRNRIQMIKFPSQLRLQRQLSVMSRNLPRYHRRETMVYFPTMPNLMTGTKAKKIQQWSFAKDSFHTARLQIMVILP